MFHAFTSAALPSARRRVPGLSIARYWCGCIALLALWAAGAPVADARQTAAPAEADPQAAVRGIATDTEGAALADVVVRLTGPATLTARSNARGEFRFAGVPAGLYAASATRSGYEPARDASLNVAPGAPAVFNVTLAPATLSTLRVIGQTSTSARRSQFNATPASVAVIPRSAFVDQGQIQVARLLDQTPGIVTGHASSAFPGSSGASPVALVSPNIRGGLPWETATLVDGHPVAVQGAGFYWLQSLNSFALDSVEITKGPGAASLIDNDAINGAVNFRTLDPTARPTAALTVGSDNDGGLFSNIVSRGTTDDGKVGWVVDYSVAGSPGPLRDYGVPIVTNIGTSPAGQTIGGFPVAANPYGAASPPPGILNSYQGSKTTLVACCEPLNSTYTSKTELLKLRYRFSPASVLTASYFGNQLYTVRDGYGIESLLTTFSPGAAYTGSLPKGATVVSAGSYFPPNESLTNNEPMFNVEFRTTRERDTVLARLYTDSLNVDLSNGLDAPNQTYTTVFVSVNGTLTTSKCPPRKKTCTVAFNGGPETAVLPGQYNATPVTDHLLGGSFEYDHSAGPNVYSLSYDDSTSTASWIKTSANYPAIGATYLVPTANYVIPPGSSERQTTLLARANISVSPRLAATIANYLNLYVNRFDTTQSSAGIPAGSTSRSFTHDDPRLGLTYRVNSDAVIRASAGSSTAPPFLQLYQVSTTPTVTSAGVIYSPTATSYAQFLNNPDLRPETAFGYDVGGDVRLRDGITLVSADGYLTNLRDQFFEAVIDSGKTFNNGKNGAGKLYYTQYQNLSHARYAGIELTLRRDPPRGFGFIAAGSLQRAYPYDLAPSFYGSAGTPIANLGIVAGHNFVASNSNNQTGGFNASAINTSTVSIPYSQGYAELSYGLARNGRLALGTTYYGPNNSYGIPAFFVSNATARYGLDRHTTAQLSVDNLFAVHTALFITANGGIAVPLANGAFGSQNANTVGPTTLRFFVTRELGR